MYLGKHQCSVGSVAFHHPLNSKPCSEACKYLKCSIHQGAFEVYKAACPLTDSFYIHDESLGQRFKMISKVASLPVEQTIKLRTLVLLITQSTSFQLNQEKKSTSKNEKKQKPTVSPQAFESQSSRPYKKGSWQIVVHN